MRLRPLLLHALLSLALVANGIGAAMASVHAVCAHEDLAAAAPAGDPPCHEDMSMAASNAHSGMQHDSAPQSSMSQYSPISDEEDCGDCAAHCACACIAHGMAALMPPPLLLPASASIAYASAPSYAHATPALPHPVRPPIG